MQRSDRVTLVFWQTRNRRVGERLAVLCSNYGLQQLTSGSCVGYLRQKERQVLGKQLSEMLTNKTENFFMVALCGDCFARSTIDQKAKNGVLYTPFEIV